MCKVENINALGKHEYLNQYHIGNLTNKNYGFKDSENVHVMEIYHIS